MDAPPRPSFLPHLYFAGQNERNSPLKKLMIGTAVIISLLTIPVKTAEAKGSCAEMHQYRIAAGLPSVFDSIGFRESRCNNTAVNRRSSTSGWWQIHPVIFRDRSGRRMAARCGAYSLSSVRGNSAAAKTRQACVAAGLYRMNGLRPWR